MSLGKGEILEGKGGPVSVATVTKGIPRHSGSLGHVLVTGETRGRREGTEKRREEEGS